MSDLDPAKVVYQTYQDENQLEKMMKMIESELSEPYSIYTYRYFVNGWKELSYIAYYEGQMIGVVIGNLTVHKSSQRLRGYVGMIVVKKEFRRLKLGRKLALMFIDQCKAKGADEVCLETECVNTAALKLYESLGFAKVKKLMSYYLNGSDAFRLKLWFTDKMRYDEIKENHQRKEKDNNSEERKQNDDHVDSGTKQEDDVKSENKEEQKEDLEDNKNTSS